MSLISLREHIERSGANPAPSLSPPDRTVETRRAGGRSTAPGPAAGAAALAGYREVVEAVGAAGERAVPAISLDFHKNLTALAEKLTPGAAPETIESIRIQVASELGQWSQNASDYFQEKTDEMREIVLVVARTAQAVGERDHRYAGQFEDVTVRLREIARLENFASVRRSLVESAAHLTACVTKMTEEGNRAIEQMQAQMDVYRSRLKEAERRASIDTLTGLANRGASETALTERIGTGRQFCVILLDLNGFKGVNDSLGHTAGDDLLKQFSAELRGQFAPSDTVGRWGGDEFIGILDGPLQQALQYLDRIERWAFGDYTISVGGQTHKIPIHAAVGLAEWDNKETSRDLISRADLALYEAKARGQSAA